MIRGLQAHLDPDRSLMLERWLRRSPTLAAALRMPTDEAWLRQLEQAEQAAAGTSDELPKKRGASAKAAAADTSLDEALAQQAFLEETLAAEDEAGCSSDEEEGCVVSMDVDLEWLLPSPRWVVAGDEDEELELEEIELEPALEWVSLDDTYGDGLSALLQHLLAQRRPSVKAWLQLREEMPHDDSGKWTDLATLEEDFVLINTEHLTDAASAVQRRYSAPSSIVQPASSAVQTV